MKAQKYGQYTKDWTNVFWGWNKPITSEQLDWIREHDGGMYHLHGSSFAVKFERKQDAEWFMLRWS